MVTKLTSLLAHMIRPYLYSRKLRHKMEVISFYYFVYYWLNGHLVLFTQYTMYQLQITTHWSEKRDCVCIYGVVGSLTNSSLKKHSWDTLEPLITSSKNQLVRQNIWRSSSTEETKNITHTQRHSAAKIRKSEILRSHPVYF